MDERLQRLDIDTLKKIVNDVLFYATSRPQPPDVFYIEEIHCLLPPSKEAFLKFAEKVNLVIQSRVDTVVKQELPTNP